MMIWISGLFAAVLFLNPLTGFAAPVITNAPSTIAKDQSITITGSGFGVKTPAAPWVWADFEGGVVEANPVSVGTLSANMPFVAVPTGMAHSTYAMAYPAATAAGKTSVRLSTNFSTQQDDFFFFMRKKYDDPNFLDSVTNYKWLRLWPLGVDNYINHIWSYNNYSTPKSNFTSEGAELMSGYYGAYSPSGVWLLHEIEVKHGAIDDASGGKMRLWENGTQLADRSFLSRTSTYPNMWGEISIENFITNDLPPIDANVVYDDIYIDTTWSRVMIGDANTFAACTKREVLIPTAWSDTSVTATVRTGVFVDTESAWIYVVDANGIPNASGYPLTISVAITPDTTPPFVTTTTPANSATGVFPNSQVTINFDDVLDCATVSSADFVFNAGSAVVNTCSGSMVVLDVTGQTFSTAYTLTVGPNINDDAANPMSASAQISYTTAASAPSGASFQGVGLFYLQ